MKTLSELTDFYYNNLFPVLEELEKQRKAIKQKFIFITIVLISSFFTIFLLFFSQNIHTMEFLLTTISITIAILTYIYKKLSSNFVEDFKNNIIGPLIKNIGPNLNYLKNKHVKQNLFERSKIFTSNIDKYEGNDYVYGQVDGVKIELSDICAQKKYQDDNNRKSWETIFEGIFIIAAFNKEFKSNTVILPDHAQNVFGSVVGNWLQANNVSRDSLTKLDDPEFEKEFVVYSQDQIEARYILTHSFMRRILEFQKKSKQKIHISFIKNHIHIAISYNKDLFEPSIFRSLLEYKISMEYVQTLHLCLGVVEELKLNHKLWSKR